MMEAVFEVDTAVQYEWATFKVYRHPDNPEMFAIKYTSGCSCNWFDEPDEQELCAMEPIHRNELRKRLTGFLTQYHSYFNAGDAIRYVDRLQDFLSARETT